MSEEEFFKEQQEQSVFKSTIVKKYFSAWANVVIPTARTMGNQIAFMDLFSGPGFFDDGSKSTPILVLEAAIENEKIGQTLVSIFNDKNKEYTKRLKKAIHDLPGIGKLRHKPKVTNLEIGRDIVNMFPSIPTLCFVDPCGYKGLSLDLLLSSTEHWGCDCIFFFNYNRVNAALDNEKFQAQMYEIFGEEAAKELREILRGESVEDRELIIVEKLTQVLRDRGRFYVLPFKFRNIQFKNIESSRISHHLILVTKSFKGYDIMKHIMAKESTTVEQGVPAFEYNPADKRFPTLFELTRPLDELESLMLREYSGKELTFDEIYVEHSVGLRYIRKNYKEVLLKMEGEKVKIRDPENKKRRKGTLPGRLVIKFL